MFTQWPLNLLRVMAAAVLLIIGCSAHANRQPTKCTGGKNSGCSIQVDFTGIYLEETCIVSIDGGPSDNTVNLTEVSTGLLQSDGSEAGASKFNITLKSCPVSKTVDLMFVYASSTVDSVTGNLINSTAKDMSENVQVRLRNSANSLMRIDDISSYQRYLIPADGADVTHEYTASYYANGSGSVTPGLVNTTAGILLLYK